jgi:hypothetical protein
VRCVKRGFIFQVVRWVVRMTASPRVYEHAGTKYMLYNGDGFGRSDFSYAVLVDE